MSVVIDNLWKVTFPGQQVDVVALAGALADLDFDSELDFRTRLLIRDSLTALWNHSGEARFNSWKSSLRASRLLADILDSDLGPPGFRSLEKRVIEPTRAELVYSLW